MKPYCSSRAFAEPVLILKKVSEAAFEQTLEFKIAETENGPIKKGLGEIPRAKFDVMML